MKTMCEFKFKKSGESERATVQARLITPGTTDLVVALS